MESKDNGVKGKKNFEEGFDNILTFDYDKEYEEGTIIGADSFIMGRRTAVLSLNGSWNFCPDIFNSLVRSRWFDEIKYNQNGLPLPYDFDFEEWETIKVPGVWNNHKKEFALYEGAGLYFKEFLYSPEKQTRVFLRFHGANYETRIWLNKKYLGRHLGGFTPFCVEVTDYLQEINRLLVSVNNTRKEGQVPSAHYDWFNYGGLHRDAELLIMPETYIEKAYIELSQGKENTFEYEVTVRSKEKITEGPAGVSVLLGINELNIVKEIYCEKSEMPDTYIGKGHIDIDEGQLQTWMPSNPKLYNVEWRIENDLLHDLVGFRRIEVKNQDIFLNGKKVFLKGMCVHEESREHLRAVTDTEIREMILTAKELGCNFLRLTHYPHNEAAARIADQLGIMLLEEIPVYWAIEFANPHTFQDAENQLRELIYRDKNRASVIIWSVGNENPDCDARYHFMKGLVQTARNLDHNRLIGASCLIDLEEQKIQDRLIAELDVVGINEYYGWYLKDFGTLETILENYKGNKPVIITEMGADAVSGMHGDAEKIYSEECQAMVYKKQFQILLKYPFIQGITPWILYDYLSMRRMSILQQGYNLKGIISADRKHKKMAYEVVYEVYHLNHI